MAITFFKTVSNNRVKLSPERYRELQDMKERQKRVDERYARQAAARRNGAAKTSAETSAEQA